jgi:hypothetical protein
MSAARRSLYIVTCASEPEWRWPCKSRVQVRRSVAGHLQTWLHRAIVLKRGKPAAPDAKFDARVDAAMARMP